MSNFKNIVLAQTLIIILLAAVIVNLIFSPFGGKEAAKGKDPQEQGLLSSRVYAGLIKPHNFAVMNFTPLKESIDGFLKKNKLSASVYVENLKSGANFGINEKEAYLPASLTKVLVAILVLRQVEKGAITLDTLINIKQTDRLDTSGTLFRTSADKLPLDVLLKAMLNESDNTALRTLKRYTDEGDRRIILNYLGYHATAEESPAGGGLDFENDHITPETMYNLFSSLYLSTVLLPEHSEFILSALVDTVFKVEKEAQLPDDVVVAHKFGARYGEQEECFHDCGIIYIHAKDMRLFYCIMTRDLEKNSAIDLIGRIVRSTYLYSLDARQGFDQYRNDWLDEIIAP